MKSDKMLKTTLVAALALGAGSGFAGDDQASLIAYARAAAPAAIGAGATVVINDEVVVEGSNGWTCMPENIGGGAMCNDALWREMMAAVANKAPFKATGVGISYMLLGDPPGRGGSNSDPYHPDPQNAEDYVETGPHIMVIVPKEFLEGITTDPSGGGPYVMWKDTDYAHIMIPVDGGQ